MPPPPRTTGSRGARLLEPQYPTEEPPNPPSNDNSTASPITPRLINPPTTHDPTTKPPWKKHKLHRKPPTSDWPLLWPRPPSWRCPPEASASTGWAGCEYVEAPTVFDPEIEGLPDWMRPRGKEGRLWSGIDRVVSVPRAGNEKKKEKKKLEGRGVSDGDSFYDEEFDIEKREDVVRALMYYPPLMGSRQHSKTSSVAPTTTLTRTATATAIMVTSTLLASPTSTLEASAPTPTPTGGERILGALNDIIAYGVMPFVVLCTALALLGAVWLFGSEACRGLKKCWGQRKQKREEKAKRKAAEEAARRAEEATIKLVELKNQPIRKDMEGSGAQSCDGTTLQGEEWEDLSLR